LKISKVSHSKGHKKGVRPEGKSQLLRVLASQSGQMLNVSELANTAHLAKQTIEEYLFILENTYIIKLLPPFYKNIRSELFKTPKIFFYDTGLPCMLWMKE
jgi:predicted AAA+ superfamily ATPase